MNRLSFHSLVTIFFTFFVISCITVCCVFLDDHKQSYILVYWPQISLAIGVIGAVYHTYHWDELRGFERYFIFSLFLQLFRHYEMFGEDIYFRDEQFRSDFCKRFLGLKGRWHCVYDEPMIFAVNCLSEYLIGITGVLLQNESPIISSSSLCFSMCLSVFQYYLVLKGTLPVYIAGTVCSIPCFFVAVSGVMKMLRTKHLSKLELLKSLFLAILMRAIALMGLTYHTGTSRYERAHRLVYIDGNFHPMFMVFLSVLACCPFLWYYCLQQGSYHDIIKKFL